MSSCGIEHYKHDDQKKRRVDELRGQFIKLFTMRETMVGYLRQDLFYRYVQLLGRQTHENFRLKIEVRALKMKVELAQAAVNRNLRPVIVQIEREVNKKLHVYYQQIREQAEQIARMRDVETISDYSMMELKNLYRTLVRRLHPDLHPNLNEQMQDLFVKAQAAYKEYDMKTLREIVRLLDMQAPVDDVVAAHETIEQAIARIEHDIASLNNEIDMLKQSFPFNLEKNLTDQIWVREKQAELQREHEALLHQQEVYSQRLDILTSL